MTRTVQAGPSSQDAPLRPLSERFDAFLLHLEGGAVREGRVADEAPEVIEALRRAGKRTVLVGSEGAPELRRAIEGPSARRFRVEVAPDVPSALGRLGRPPGRVLAVGGPRAQRAAAAPAGVVAAVVLEGGPGPAALLDHDALPAAVMADLRGILRPIPPVEIRPARGSDGPSVRRLLDEGGLLGEGPLGEALVAEDGAVLATASVAVEGTTAYLHSVAVARAARRTGLGTLVVAGAARHAVSQGAAEVTLVTEDAEGFFRRLGCRPIARDGLPGWIAERSRACARTAVAMRRPLRPGPAEPPGG